MKKRQTPQQAVDRWNAEVKIGDIVEYRSRPDAEPRQCKTVSAATVLSGHTAVVWLEGMRGCAALNACKPIKKSAASDSPLNWRPADAKPNTSKPITAIIVANDDDPEFPDPFVCGIYLWRDGRWHCEDTGKPLEIDVYWWLPEDEFVKTVPRT